MGKVLKGRAWLLCFAIALLLPVGTRADADKDREISTVRKLLRESRQLVNDPESYELVQAIGLAHAAAGDVDLALETMKSIKKPLQVDVGLREIAVVLAEQGDSQGAERIVKMIKDETKGYAAQVPIAWEQMGHAYARAAMPPGTRV